MANSSNEKSSWMPQDIPKILIIDPRQFKDNLLNYETKSKLIRLFQVLKKFSEKWFSHVLLLGLLVLYAVIGGWIFEAIEGSNERNIKKPINEMREKVIEKLLKERMSYELDDGRPEMFAPKMPRQWVIKSRELLEEFELTVNKACEVGVVTDSEQTKWSFWGGLFFSMTVFTTIGYGDNTPKTDAGKAVTMIYAFFGIPILLMVLADFGKLFTRGIKFLFKFIRRLYYTRSLRKMRQVGRDAKEESTQYMIAAIDAFNKGIAHIPHAPKIPNLQESDKEKDSKEKVPKIDKTRPFPGYKTPQYWYSARHPGFRPEMMSPYIIRPNPMTPTTSATTENEEPESPIFLDQMAMDDEFNLPISLALTMLMLYLLLGAVLFWIWEDWTLFEAFYFVFISMSTIGFGDLIPDHPKIMISTFIYLIFGLALTSMCINVIQEKLSSTFQRAKMTIGETVGLDVDQIMSEDEAGEDKSQSSTLKPEKSSDKSRSPSKESTSEKKTSEIKKEKNVSLKKDQKEQPKEQEKGKTKAKIPIEKGKDTKTIKTETEKPKEKPKENRFDQLNRIIKIKKPPPKTSK